MDGDSSDKDLHDSSAFTIRLRRYLDLSQAAVFAIVVLLLLWGVLAGMCAVFPYTCYY